MKEEKKVVHEVKLNKSIIKLLWVFAVVLLLNAVPKDMLIPEAEAQVSGFQIESAATRGIENVLGGSCFRGFSTQSGVPSISNIELVFFRNC